MFRTIALAILALACAGASPAAAHHVMDGALPDSFVAGLLSGFGHPVIGIDHLAFIAVVGLASAFAPRPLLSPLAFVVATVAGCGLLLGGVALPAVEIVITGSVIAVGAMVVSGRDWPAAAYPALFAVAGLFHGWAYGGSIVGAEATPLAAYLIGFAAIQYAIAAGFVWLTRTVWQAATPVALQPRIAGAVAAGVGVAFFVETLEGMLFV